VWGRLTFLKSEIVVNNTTVYIEERAGPEPQDDGIRERRDSDSSAPVRPSLATLCTSDYPDAHSQHESDVLRIRAGVTLARQLLFCRTQAKNRQLFDHPVRLHQHFLRNRQTDLFRRFQVDDELELGWLFHRQFRGFGAF
jgi:hypothetical protein